MFSGPSSSDRAPMFSGPVAWKLDRGTATVPLDRGSDPAPIEAPGQFNVRFTDAVAISMSTDTETHKQISDEDVPTVEGLVGIYWKISEAPVFKRDLPAGGSLYIAKAASDGWFICTKPDPEPDANRVAWLKGDFPISEDGAGGQIHVPFWARKRCAALTICSQHAFAELSAQELHQLIAEQSAQATVEDGGKAPQKKEEKDHGATRSGWLNKCAKLIEAIDENDWSSVYGLAKEYKNTETMKRVLDSSGASNSKRGFKRRK